MSGELRNMHMTNLRISNFDSLPDSALLSVKELIALSGRSRTSLWRDVQRGFLGTPIKVGKASTRWNVAQVRAYLTGKQLRVSDNGS